jgi:replicative DNA helicase
MACRAGRDEQAEVGRFRTLRAQAARSGSLATGPEATVSKLAEESEESKPRAEVETEPLSRYLSELIPDVLDEIEAVGSRDTAPGTFRIPTGFDDLDYLLGGWSQGYLIIVGGRPSAGKTTLLLNFCRAASVKYRLPTMVISGEMNNRELQSRLLSAEARVPLHLMRTGQMNDEEWARLARTMSALADAPLRIGTPPDFQLERLIAEATNLARESRLKLLLIDSLQWIIGREAPAQVSAEFTLWRLKTLAETLKIPIIITAQAERGQERILTTNAIAQLMHNNAIERVADVVIMLDRPDQDDREHPRAGEADLIVAKNRNGPTATVTAAYQGHYSRFVDMVSNDYPMFRPNAPIEVQATVHDRNLFRRLLEEIPPDGQVIDWLRNNFMLKAQPLRRFEIVERVAKTMSLEVIGFDDKEANDRYNDLRSAIDNFCDKIPYYTETDPGNNWLELPADWRDKEDRQQYDTARSAIADARNAFVEAYDSFLQACHKRGIDGDGRMS